MLDNFYGNIIMRTRRSEVRAFVGGSLLEPECCKPKDYTGTHYTPIKGQMNTKSKHIDHSH